MYLYLFLISKVVAMILNFNSLLMFYFPCLVLNLNRIRLSGNCFTFLFSNYQERIVEKAKPQKPNSEFVDENDDEDGDNIIIVNDFVQNTVDKKQENDEEEESNHKNENLKKKSNLKKIACSKMNEIKSSKINLFDFLFDTKLKYFILVLFVVYFCFNLTILITKYKADLPVTDLIPQESYLRKHMVNHQQLFNVGPIIMINFMKPIQYWNVTKFKMIRSLVNDIKSLPSVEKIFEINWLQDTYYAALNDATFNEDCHNPLNFSCFHRIFIDSVASNDLLVDDVNFNNTNNPKTFEIKSSRIYLSFENFFGSQQEMNLMNDIKYLAVNKYNFTLNEDVVIFSSVYVFLEQMEELTPTLITFMLLNIECCILISFILIFDLKTIIIMTLILFSVLVSIASNIFLFNFTLNMMVLVHFIMIPALISEFFYSPLYSYLYSFKFDQKKGNNLIDSRKKKLKCSSSNSKCNENVTPTTSCEESSLADNSTSFKFFKSLFNRKTKSNKKKPYKHLKYSYDKTIRHSIKFLLILFLNLFIILNCTTYSFRALCLILISFSFNLLIHLYLFLPALLSIFGSRI
jgi:hypothetical protein